MQDIFSSRKLFIQAVILIACIVFILKLFYLQVIDSGYREKSNENAIKELIVYPPRGQIFDRNSKLIVHNENLFDIMVTYNEVPKNIDSIRLCEYLGIDMEYYQEQMKKAKKQSRYKEFQFLKQVSIETYNRFQEHIHKFKGFYGQSRFIRNYPDSSAALILGDIGEVDSSQIKASEDYVYLSGEYIGKNGLEQSYEKYLRGQRGVKTVMVDAFGRVLGSFSEGQYDKKSKAGDDLISTLDVELQKFGEALLTNKKGSIVAI
jgi:penicillin-binding protein 2